MATSDPTAAIPVELRDPDVRLMLRVRDDDAPAFEELVCRYQARLIGVLEHLVGDRQQAEDLAQEVFLRVFRSRKNYQPAAKFSTWLFTIANHVALNARRNRARRREVHLDADSNASRPAVSAASAVMASSGQMPARQLDKAEMRDVVRAAVGGLNERQRMAVLLNKFEGMNYQEIADVMEMSVKAIKSLLMRARVNLRELLEPYLEHGAPPDCG